MNFFKKKYIFIFFSLLFLLSGYAFSVDFDLPESVGSAIDFSHRDATRNNKLVIFIQNVPFNVEVQSNIYTILSILKTAYKDRLKIIGVEGDYGYINTRILNDVPSFAFRKRLVNRLLNLKLLTGAEAFMSRYNNIYGDIFLYGVDDWKLLNDSSSFLKTGILRYNNWNKEFEKLEKKLNFLIDKKDKNLADFYKLKDKYYEGDIYLNFYAIALIKKYPELNLKSIYVNFNKYIEIIGIENNLDMVSVELEQKYVVEKMIKSNYFEKEEIDSLLNIANKYGYEKNFYLNLDFLLKKKNIDISKDFSNLYNYMEYLHKMDEINFGVLYSETKIFERNILDKICPTKEKKELVL